MNRLELVTEVRRMLREETAAKSAHTDASLQKLINEGIKDMCVKGGVYERSLSFTAATGDASYIMPLQFIKAKDVSNHNGVSLDLIELGMVGKVYVTTGLPHWYYMKQLDASFSSRANTTAYVTFPATTSISLTYLVPATANGYLYECTIAGTSAGSPPTYSLVLGATTADGTVTWTTRELIGQLWELNLHATPTTAGAGTGTYIMTYQAIDESLAADTDSPNFPWDKHHLLVDYTCWRALSANRQFKDSMPFILNYTKSLGLKVEEYVGGER